MSRGVMVFSALVVCLLIGCGATWSDRVRDEAASRLHCSPTSINLVARGGAVDVYDADGCGGHATCVLVRGRDRTRVGGHIKPLCATAVVNR